MGDKGRSALRSLDNTAEEDRFQPKRRVFPRQKDPRIGRRTGQPVVTKKDIKKDERGFELLSEYFSDTESEDSLVISEASSKKVPPQKLKDIRPKRMSSFSPNPTDSDLSRATTSPSPAVASNNADNPPETSAPVAGPSITVNSPPTEKSAPESPANPPTDDAAESNAKSTSLTKANSTETVAKSTTVSAPPPASPAQAIENNTEVEDMSTMNFEADESGSISKISSQEALTGGKRLPALKKRLTFGGAASDSPEVSAAATSANTIQTESTTSARDSSRSADKDSEAVGPEKSALPTKRRRSKKQEKTAKSSERVEEDTAPSKIQTESTASARDSSHINDKDSEEAVTEVVSSEKSAQSTKRRSRKQETAAKSTERVQDSSHSHDKDSEEGITEAVGQEKSSQTKQRRGKKQEMAAKSTERVQDSSHSHDKDSEETIAEAVGPEKSAQTKQRRGKKQATAAKSSERVQEDTASCKTQDKMQEVMPEVVASSLGGVQEDATEVSSQHKEPEKAAEDKIDNDNKEKKKEKTSKKVTQKVKGVKRLPEVVEMVDSDDEEFSNFLSLQPFRINLTGRSNQSQVQAGDKSREELGEKRDNGGETRASEKSRAETGPSTSGEKRSKLKSTRTDQGQAQASVKSREEVGVKTGKSGESRASEKSRQESGPSTSGEKRSKSTSEQPAKKMKGNDKTKKQKKGTAKSNKKESRARNSEPQPEEEEYVLEEQDISVPSIGEVEKNTRKRKSSGACVSSVVHAVYEEEPSPEIPVNDCHFSQSSHEGRGKKRGSRCTSKKARTSQAIDDSSEIQSEADAPVEISASQPDQGSSQADGGRKKKGRRKKGSQASQSEGESSGVQSDANVSGEVATSPPTQERPGSAVKSQTRKRGRPRKGSRSSQSLEESVESPSEEVHTSQLSQDDSRSIGKSQARKRRRQRKGSKSSQSLEENTLIHVSEANASLEGGQESTEPKKKRAKKATKSKGSLAASKSSSRPGKQRKAPQSLELSEDDSLSDDDPPVFAAHPTPSRSILKGGRNYTPRASTAELPRASIASPLHYADVTQSETVAQREPNPSARKLHIISPSKDPTPGKRRSRRNRAAPVAWWEGQRVKYERRKSGRVMVGITSPQAETQPKKKLAKVPARPRKPRPRTPAPLQQEIVPDVSVHQDVMPELQEVENPKIPVVNPASSEEFLIDAVKTTAMFDFRGPQGKEAREEDGIKVCKALRQPQFSVGQIILEPNQEKGTQFIRNDTLAYVVMEGKLAVTIHRSTVMLQKGDMFLVPAGNTYNIKNLRNDRARLCFYQLKAPNPGN